MRCAFLLVPVTGLEPVRCRQRRILSPLRLPFHHTGVCLYSIVHIFQKSKRNFAGGQCVRQTVEIVLPLGVLDTGLGAAQYVGIGPLLAKKRPALEPVAFGNMYRNYTIAAVMMAIL